MKLLFDKARWMMDSESTWLMLKVSRRDATAFIDEMKEGKTYEADLKEHRKKRSLDANAYCFVLINKIAEKTGISIEEIYRRAVRELGGNNTIVCVKDEAVEELCFGWRLKGLGWQAETVPSKLDGCTNVVLYYGSSTYDTKTMSRLIDYVVQDAKALGIETMSPAELALLMDGWSV